MKKLIIGISGASGAVRGKETPGEEALRSAVER